jgi:hypothetical protein
VDEVIFNCISVCVRIVSMKRICCQRYSQFPLQQNTNKHTHTQLTRHNNGEVKYELTPNLQ